MFTFNWSDENVDRLKACIAAGMSASQAGGELGCTRNAVIGKMSRLKIKPANKSGGQKGEKRRVVRPRAATPEPVQSERRQRFHPPTPLKPPSDLKDTHYEAPVSTRRTLQELGPTDCRWPCGHPGEPGFFFCGASKVKDHPYCGGHCFIAYQPAARQQARYVEVAA